uniref:hypothetical protein n=1 Tax=Helicotheca tamesis TaxID=374047 RepID=UPI002028C35F|nr:hypothetical protein NDE27_mgp09 [Helicotheca tamesis]QYB23034.1 hypothetical protein [Helicotheca tamesis]
MTKKKLKHLDQLDHLFKPEETSPLYREPVTPTTSWLSLEPQSTDELEELQVGGLTLDAETIPKAGSPENIKEPLTIFEKILNIPQPLPSNNYDVIEPYDYDYLPDSLTQTDYDMVITQQDVCRMDRYQLYLLDTYSRPDPYMPYVHGRYIPDPNSPGKFIRDPNFPGPYFLDSNSPGPNSPGPNSPGPNSPGPNSPGPNSPGPNSPDPNSPGPNSPDPNSPDPGMPELNIPDFIDIRMVLICECLPLRPVFMFIVSLYFSPILILSIKILLGSYNLKGVAKVSKLVIKSIKRGLVYLKSLIC